LGKEAQGMTETEKARHAKGFDLLEPSFNQLPGPTPATLADTRRVKALTRAVAMELRQHGTPALNAADRVWIEGCPQSLWPLLDFAVAVSTARKRDEPLVTACHWLLANQLELIRYRLERGHDWARTDDPRPSRQPRP
jgi:hypothetical protein